MKYIVETIKTDGRSWVMGEVFRNLAVAMNASDKALNEGWAIKCRIHAVEIPIVTVELEGDSAKQPKRP